MSHQFQVIREVAEMWAASDTKCLLVNGRPRHPQSQGAVERANRDIGDMLTAWMRENST